MHWLDHLTLPVAPRWTARRIRARIAAEMLGRAFEGAAAGRRTQGWRRSGGDANAVMAPALARLRATAHDLVENNPYAEGAINTIVDDVIGWGITADAAPSWWPRWAETTACDADGREDLYGLQSGVLRTVAESGECLIRRRWRRPEDGWPIPLQLQVMEPDFLDSAKDGIATPGGGRTIQGVEFDGLGRRTRYWLFRDHPGTSFAGGSTGASVPVPAAEILHVFRPGRRGAVRGYSWFAPVMLRMKDFDDFADATLMKQKVAACLAIVTSDVDGTSPPLGTVDAAAPAVDMLEPGGIHNIAPGRAVTVVEPPSVSDYDPYTRTLLRAIARGLGITYEDCTGDYTALPFSAARMSRLRYWRRVESLRWKMLVPQFCDPVYAWAMEAAGVMSMATTSGTSWTAPPMAMIDPAAEGLAAQRNIRSGISTLSEEIRERGYQPKKHLAAIAADNKELDRLGIILDSDPRRTTQQGGPRETAATVSAAAPEPSQNGAHA